MNREDFPILNDGRIYFDSAATSLKPQVLIDKTVEYYSKYSTNAHRGEYETSFVVNQEYEECRSLIKDFINAKESSEISFNKGASEGLNQIIFGYYGKHLEPGDEVIISRVEHAANVLPWFKLVDEKQIVIKYVELDQKHGLSIENLKKVISDRTKVISLAHVTNTLGDKRPIEEIGKLCLEKNIDFVLDASQSIGHMKIDVQKANISFLAFSAHKVLGPTGLGILYGKRELLEKTDPLIYGGGMNSYFEEDGSYELKSIPTKFEGGTQNIAAILAFKEVILYLQKIGLEKINDHCLELRNYALEEMKKIDKIIIYNQDIESNLILFNIDGVFAQDTALFLNSKGISLRSGNHCAKILKEEIKITNSCRLSFYLYNTKEEVDKLIEVLKKQDEIYDGLVK